MSVPSWEPGVIDLAHASYVYGAAAELVPGESDTDGSPKFGLSLLGDCACGEGPCEQRNSVLRVKDVALVIAQLAEVVAHHGHGPQLTAEVDQYRQTIRAHSAQHGRTP
jgi:hypothetical protein